MEFWKFITEVFSKQNIYLIILTISIFSLLYIFLFKKQLWGIFDPLFIPSVMMGGVAYCIYYMYIKKTVDFKYIHSFLITEISLIIGMVFSYSISYKKKSFLIDDTVYHVTSKNFINIMLYISAIFYIVTQIIVFIKIGFVLFMNDSNHVSAFDGQGPIRALLSGSRSTFILVLFYKYFCYKISFVDKLLLLFYFISVCLGGSKSAILPPIVYFFTMNYCLYKMGVVKRIKIKLLILVPLFIFPIVIIMIQNMSINIEFVLFLLIGRIIGSGDIFVMGYNDNVINSLVGDSFFYYVFYPGFGSILKNLGFPLTPPIVLGSQIYKYYYGIGTAGPNARHNYLGLFFLGPYLSIFFSFFCGTVIGFVRGKIIRNRNFFNLMFYMLLYTTVISLITDVLIFMNSFFWSSIFFLLIYFISDIIFISVNEK
jgi:hypothetical protein